MRKQTTLIVSSLLGLFLTISMLNSVPLVSATHVPSDVIETGDQFRFDELFNKTSLNTRYFTMYNQTDPDQLFHGDHEYNYEYIAGHGATDVGFIREGGQVTNLGEMDTWISLRGETQTDPGSHREGFQNSTDHPEGQPAQWQNPPLYTEDLSGRHDGHEESIGMMSNATYAIIFPDVNAPSIDLNDDNNNGEGPFGIQITGWDGTVPRTMYYITTETMNIDINGVTRTLSTKTIHLVWSGTWSDSATRLVWFGEENHPNTPKADVFMQVNVSISLQNTYTYDTTNTLLLKTTNQASISIDFDMPVQNVTIASQNGYSQNVTVSQTATGVYGENRKSVMSFADNFYGNTRAAATGTSRIGVGEHIEYEFDEGSSFYFDMDNHISSPNWFLDQEMYAYVDQETEGTVTIDVYNDASDFFEAVLILDGTSYYDVNVHRYQNENNTRIENPPDQIGTVTMPGIFYQLQKLPYDADHDILPFFEDRMYLDSDFFGDCEGGDCFNLPYQHEVNKVGTVNVSHYYINLLVEFDGDTSELPVINGFTQYEFNVEEHTQLYGYEYTQNMQFPLGDGPGAIMMDVTLSAYAEGRQSFYYDDDTGALVSMNQELYGEIVFEGIGSVSVPNEGGGTSTVSYDIYIALEWYDWFNLLLSGHPDYYDSQPPQPTLPSSSSELTSGNTSADLPLPVPFLPTLFGIIAIGVMVRRRK